MLAGGTFSPTESLFSHFGSALDFAAPTPVPGLDSLDAALLRSSMPAAHGVGASGTARNEDMDQATAELEKKDPLAAQVWRLYGDRTASLPTDETIESITWRFMGMGLGDLRRRLQEKMNEVGEVPMPSVGEGHGVESEGVTTSKTTSKAASPEVEKAPMPRSVESLKPAKEREPSVERGRRGRSSAGSRSHSGTPDEDTMCVRTRRAARFCG